MKAWYLSTDDDYGHILVFAETRNKARAQADSEDLPYDTWLDIQATRAKKFDGMEGADIVEIHIRLWRENGWRWVDMDTPEPEETTDEQFREWHEGNIA